jgi:hypothetical protein
MHWEFIRRRGFVIGLELLDNLPHDKVILDVKGVIGEAVVAEEEFSKSLYKGPAPSTTIQSETSETTRFVALTKNAKKRK